MSIFLMCIWWCIIAVSINLKDSNADNVGRFLHVHLIVFIILFRENATYKDKIIHDNIMMDICYHTEFSFYCYLVMNSYKCPYQKKEFLQMQL
jgi:hypothetical protein